MKIAIVGAGVSGLVVAHRLHERHEVTVFEEAPRVGGHTNTVRVDLADATHHVDTGFIVHNDRNYPRFEALMAKLGVQTQPSVMTFGVADTRGNFEYCSASANGLFANRAHLVQPWFHRMVAEIPRFQREARALIDDVAADGVSLGDWLHERRYSPAFIERLIVPQASAVWSADPREMWRFPARFLARFFHNHGMLGLRDRPAVAHRRRRLAGLRRCARAPVARPHPRRHAGHGDPAPRRPRRGAAARRRPRALRRGRPRGRTPTRRCACSPTRTAASASSSGRSRTSSTRPCCTPTARCCRGAAGRGRAGTTTCSTTRRPARP